MNIFKQSLLLAVPFVVQCGNACHAQPDSLLQEVLVVISVRTDSGQPLADVGLQIQTESERAFAVTDANGDATAVLPASKETDLAVVKLAPARPNDPKGTKAPTASSMRDMKEFARIYSFADMYEMPVDPALRAGNLEIRVGSATSITGSLLTQDGKPLKATILVRDRAFLGAVKPDGTFSIGGIRRGEGGEAYFVMDDARVIPLSVTAQQTISEVVILDPVRVPASENTTVIETLITAPTRQLGVTEPIGLTLINENGSCLYSFTAIKSEESRLLRISFPNKGPARVLPGEYWVAPGFFMASPTQIKLLDAVRVGAIKAGSEIPKIIVTPEGSASLRLDADSVKAKIEALAVR